MKEYRKTEQRIAESILGPDFDLVVATKSQRAAFAKALLSDKDYARQVAEQRFLIGEPYPAFSDSEGGDDDGEVPLSFDYLLFPKSWQQRFSREWDQLNHDSESLEIRGVWRQLAEVSWQDGYYAELSPLTIDDAIQRIKLIRSRLEKASVALGTGNPQSIIVANQHWSKAVHYFYELEPTLKRARVHQLRSSLRQLGDEGERIQQSLILKSLEMPVWSIRHLQLTSGSPGIPTQMNLIDLDTDFWLACEEDCEDHLPIEPKRDTKRDKPKKFKPYVACLLHPDEEVQRIAAHLNTIQPETRKKSAAVREYLNETRSVGCTMEEAKSLIGKMKKFEQRGT